MNLDKLYHHKITTWLHVLVILSLLLASCSSPNSISDTGETTKAQTEPTQMILEESSYVPPSFVHPEPVIGKRPSEDFNMSLLQEGIGAGLKDATEFVSMPTPQVMENLSTKATPQPTQTYTERRSIQSASAMATDAKQPDSNCLDGECVFWVSSSSDDAGTNSITCIYSTLHNEVYMGTCSGGQFIVSGFRFPNVTIPPGTKIAEAYIEFTVDGPYSDPITVTFNGEDSGNASPFSTLPSGMPNNRPITQASATWDIPTTDHWILGELRNSPDLTDIVQEIVDRSDWSSGNAIAMIMKTTAASGSLHARRVIGYDRLYANGPARLIIRLQTSVDGGSIFNGGGMGDACQPQTNAIANVLGPINTSTGGLSYHSQDISIPTSAGALNFVRTYSSSAVDLYATELGYGWTHNLDSRLIFPGDPGGEAGYVLFKERTANLYRFVILDVDTFSPVPGIQGNLTLTGGQYVLTLPTQSKYTFDSDGQLQTWQDSEGRTWEYEYRWNGKSRG